MNGVKDSINSVISTKDVLLRDGVNSVSINIV